MNFSLMFTQIMKDLRDLSVAHCFLAEFQVAGVYLPITFPNSVSVNTNVPAYPSHFLWRYIMKNEFFVALKSSLVEVILESKKRVRGATSPRMQLPRMEAG